MLFCAALCLPSAFAQSPSCRVRDPEISGQYLGACNAEGWAEGQGLAIGSIARYEGTFANGTKHGRGVKTWLATGDVYEGEFVSDYRHGLGTYTWGGPAPQARYSGSFDQDARHGEGTFAWPNGDTYSGPWRRDIQVGELTPMQKIKRGHADAWFKALGGLSKEVCKVGNPMLRAKLLRYEAGEATVQPTVPEAATQTTPVLMWRACAAAS